MLHGRGKAANAKAYELGAAHVNLEEILRTEREPQKERLAWSTSTASASRRSA